MFLFNDNEGASALSVWGVWIAIFVILFGLNELIRRRKYIGFFCFTILPIILSVLWFTVLKDSTYTDWFHLAKVYSATAGCIGFWCISHVSFRDKSTGKVHRLSDKKWALLFPPIILAINIIEAVVQDFQVGILYFGGGTLENSQMYVLGGPWNFMNGIAGILNIITITGWSGICIKKATSKDKSRDMLWPDMLWFWIIAYDLWNFAYTYNCLPGHAWYCGFALLLVPTLCSFTTGKGAWLQHRAQTLALWCMFAQTFPVFLDEGAYSVASTYDKLPLFAASFLALIVNIAVAVFILYTAVKTKKNPYSGELFKEWKSYKAVKDKSIVEY